MKEYTITIKNNLVLDGEFPIDKLNMLRNTSVCLIEETGMCDQIFEITIQVKEGENVNEHFYHTGRLVQSFQKK